MLRSAFPTSFWLEGLKKRFVADGVSLWPMVELVEGAGAGGGWVGLGWVSACAEGEGPPPCASLSHQGDWASASGCLVSQPPRPLKIPVPH